MNDSDRYQTPLATRYASEPMQQLWGPRHRIGLWRRTWLALAECQRELGLPIPDDAIAGLRAHLDDADLDAAADYERRFRHDVMAHVHALGDQAPRARPYLHLGATSAFITDNADLMVIRDAYDLLLGRLVAVLEALRGFATEHASLPCLAYTHFQPAQLTTVGKRATLWLHDFASDTADLLHRRSLLRARGCKGTTGTQASFLELFAGDHDKVRALDDAVASRLGFEGTIPVTGQTYPRKIDAGVLDLLSGIAQSAAKMAHDLRLLQHEGELLEPFEASQIGSSAMAYKRNPMRAERVGALARFVISLQANGAHTAAAQWLERTLDDSANRRMTLPEAFLAVDAILLLVENIVRGMEVQHEVIGRHVAQEMPFMATERWLMQATRQGGDRQELHAVIRKHSMAVAEAMAREGGSNDLLERLANDPAFAQLSVETLQADLTPRLYIGRAAEQVTEYLRETLDPLLATARPHASALSADDEIRV